jgi:hypothetical protein
MLLVTEEAWFGPADGRAMRSAEGFGAANIESGSSPGDKIKETGNVQMNLPISVLLPQRNIVTAREDRPVICMRLV